MTQQNRILDHIRRNGFITSFHASQLGIMDLQGQIHAMERKGYSFDHVWDESGKFKKYYLLSEPEIEAARTKKLSITLA